MMGLAGVKGVASWLSSSPFSVWRLLSASSITPHAASLTPVPSTPRAMSFLVDVIENDVDGALKLLRRNTDAAGLQKELSKRRCFLNGCQRRFEREKETYNRTQGRVIAERLKWVKKRTVATVARCGGGGRYLGIMYLLCNGTPTCLTPHPPPLCR